MDCFSRETTSSLSKSKRCILYTYMKVVVHGIILEQLRIQVYSSQFLKDFTTRVSASILLNGVDMVLSADVTLGQLTGVLYS
ncbi:hypothetical protein V6N13_074284 [Hibiscus sabdariffa]